MREHILCSNNSRKKSGLASESRLQLKNYNWFNVTGVFSGCEGVERFELER